MDNVKDFFLIFLSVMAIINCYFTLQRKQQYNDLKQQNIELTQKCEYYDSILTSMCTVGEIGENN